MTRLQFLKSEMRQAKQDLENLPAGSPLLISMSLRYKAAQGAYETQAYYAKRERKGRR